MYWHWTLALMQMFITVLSYRQSMKLRLDGWDLGITFSACHFLPGHSKCNRLHGHNYAINLEIEGDMKGDGIIFDFVALKSAMREIASELDHCVLMPGRSEAVNVRVGEDVWVECDGKSYSFPGEDVNVLDIEVISAEALAEYILDKMLDSLDITPNLQSISVGVDEGKGQGAWACKKL